MATVDYSRDLRAAVAQLVERQLPKLNVESSSLFGRSIASQPLGPHALAGLETRRRRVDFASLRLRFAVTLLGLKNGKRAEKG